MLILLMATALTGILFYLVREKRIAAKLALQASAASANTTPVVHSTREQSELIKLKETTKRN